MLPRSSIILSGFQLVILFLCIHKVLSYTTPCDSRQNLLLSRRLLSKYHKTNKKLSTIYSTSTKQISTTTTTSSTCLYVIPDGFTPPEVGAEIYIGSAVSMIPIIWATYEFNSRIQTQRNCLLCQGSGLVKVTRNGNALTRPRKCWSCGGFLPWLGWKMFFFSTFFDIGNGGPLQRPAKDYNKINEAIKTKTLESADTNNTDINESISDSVKTNTNINDVMNKSL